ncbi:hypothetical protein pb186bvf_012644 [Paramecium bursaria]
MRKYIAVLVFAYVLSKQCQYEKAIQVILQDLQTFIRIISQPIELQQISHLCKKIAQIFVIFE